MNARATSVLFSMCFLFGFCSSFFLLCKTKETACRYKAQTLFYFHLGGVSLSFFCAVTLLFFLSSFFHGTVTLLLLFLRFFTVQLPCSFFVFVFSRCSYLALSLSSFFSRCSYLALSLVLFFSVQLPCSSFFGAVTSLFLARVFWCCYLALFVCAVPLLFSNTSLQHSHTNGSENR